MTQPDLASDDELDTILQPLTPEHAAKLKSLTARFDTKSQTAIARAIIEGDSFVETALEGFVDATSELERCLVAAAITPQRRISARLSSKKKPDLTLPIDPVQADALAADIAAKLPTDRFVDRSQLFARLGYEPYPSSRFKQAITLLANDPAGAQIQISGQRRGRTYKAAN